MTLSFSCSSLGALAWALLGCAFAGSQLQKDSPLPDRKAEPAGHAFMRKTKKSVSLDLPPRVQWDANFGYCGEISFIMAGLYYGQYLSQYDARALVSRDGTQSHKTSQLLLDENEDAAAKAMKLRYEIWPKTGTPADFLLWTKNHLLKGHPVIWGVYANTKLFKITPNRGENYDHIVPVIQFRSHHDITENRIYPDDEVTFSDNGDYTHSVRRGPITWSYALSKLIYRRSEQRDQPYYLNDGENSGVAILGIEDENNETLRVQVKTGQSHEHGEINDGEDERPDAKPVTLRIRISGLIPGVHYKLYKYDSLAGAPVSNFNAQRHKAAKEFDIMIPSGSTLTISETIISDDMAIYRAVEAAGP